MSKLPVLPGLQEIENNIFTIRGVQVMLDSHLAELYGVETKTLNQAVKRNMVRFPDTFRFQLTLIEEKELRSQFVTSSSAYGGRRYLPYVFTEQGVAMLSAVLRSETAIKVSVQVMQAFVQLRKFKADNSGIYHRLDKVEHKQLESDEKFERIFDALQSKDLAPKQGIFYDGQIFDAYKFLSDIVRRAGKSIILIDNYVNDTVLNLFVKRKKGVTFTIFTKNISNQLALDLQKHNAQYEPVIIKEFHLSHDRFILIDNKELYHIGASLKDLGLKWFAFSKMDTEAWGMITKLKSIK